MKVILSQRILRCLFTALLMSSALISCRKEEPKALTPVIRPVRTVQVFSSGGNRMRSFAGVAQAGVESKMSFKVSGTIRKIYAKVGHEIKNGQPIAKIDDKDYKLQVQQAEAGLAQGIAQARNARANYNRVQLLYENRNASRNDLDAARTAYDSTQANVRSIEKRLEMARLQLDYTNLRAPAHGTISSGKCFG